MAQTTVQLSTTAYEETLRKLAMLESRLQSLDQRSDVDPALNAEARQSYEEMIRQFRREIKLYEATRAHENQPA